MFKPQGHVFGVEMDSTSLLSAHLEVRTAGNAAKRDIFREYVGLQEL